MSKTLSYAILGSGAIGGFYGLALHRAGEEVHFLARSDYSTILRNGLVLHTNSGEIRATKVNVYQLPDDLPPVDVAIVATKTTSNGDMARSCARVLSPRGVTIVLQNGLEPEKPFANVLGKERVAGGACYIGCHKIAPGVIQHVCHGRIVLGFSHQRVVGTFLEEVMMQFQASLACSGIQTSFTAYLRLERWKKLVWNIPFNALTTFRQLRVDELLRDPATRNLILEIMNEVLAIAAADGCDIESDYPDKMLALSESMAPYATSMQSDYANGREMEIESILGEPLRSAFENGLRPKQIQSLYDDLKTLERIRSQTARAVASSSNSAAK
jgi:2-dehydropantoate 2-reductase